MEYLTLIAENELLRIENENYKKLLASIRCQYVTKKGNQCKNNGLCKVHGMSSMLRK
jgi:regulator of replication initiation timing